MKTLTAFMLFALLLAWHPQAKAVACGDTVTTDVTLSTDLHCTTGWSALEVPVDGVTIRLNGHTLSGTNDLAGIVISNASHVTVMGPGRISGFWVGVNSVNADYLAVRNVNFNDFTAGVIASDTLASTIANNEFRSPRGTAVSIYAFPGSRSTLGSHAIVDNLVLENASGITICGHANSDNLIARNILQGISDYGIHVYDASNENLIKDNMLLKTGLAGIMLWGTRNNRITSNVIDNGQAGMVLIPQFAGECATGPYTNAAVRNNKIVRNSIFHHTVAITLGIDGTGPRVLKNQIEGNKLYNDTYGVFFNRDAYANDATGNAYYGTTTPVVDLGSGNTY